MSAKILRFIPKPYPLTPEYLAFCEAYGIVPVRPAKMNGGR